MTEGGRRDYDAEAMIAMRERAGELYVSSHERVHEDEKARVDAWRVAHKEAHDADQRALSTALVSEQRRLQEHAVAHDAAHTSHIAIHAAQDTAHVAQHQAEDKALVQAQMSIDERLHKMNELRSLVNDQSNLFATVVSLDALEKAMEMIRDEMRASSALEREERRQALSEHALVHRGEEGGRKGMSNLVGWMVGGVGFVVTVLGLIIVVTNLLTSAP